VPSHLANMIEFVLLSARPCPQRKQQIDRFSSFCTPRGRKSYTLQWAPFSPLKFTISHRGISMIPWAHPSPKLKRPLDRFSHFCTNDHRVSLYFTMGYHFPLKNCPLDWTHLISNTWFLWPTRVVNPNCISITSVIFAGLTSVTDRPTDHTTPSVSIGHRNESVPKIMLNLE